MKELNERRACKGFFRSPLHAGAQWFTYICASLYLSTFSSVAAGSSPLTLLSFLSELVTQHNLFSDPRKVTEAKLILT